MGIFLEAHGLETFRVARYLIILEPEETLLLPAYKGSTFRGAFGSAFRKMTCSEHAAECGRCILKDTCPYSVIFESSPPQGSEALRNYERVPHPFVIEPPATAKREFEPGERLEVGLVLVGRAIDYFPYFLVAFREMGRTGIGKGRHRFRVAEVTSGEDIVYSGEDGRVYNRSAVVTYPMLEDSAIARLQMEGSGCSGILTGVPSEDVEESRPGFPDFSDGVSLRFETMTRLKHQDKFINIPEFHIVIKALLARISSLLYFHHGVRMEMDFAGALAKAEAIRIRINETRWVDWERYSSRQDTRMKLGGIVGEVVYEGDVREFLPVLLLGEYIHVGKGATFGLGRVRVSVAGMSQR